MQDDKANKDDQPSNRQSSTDSLIPTEDGSFKLRRTTNFTTLGEAEKKADTEKEKQTEDSKMDKTVM